MLNLAVGFDLALQLDELVSAPIDPAQHSEAHPAHHDQQEFDGEKCRQQLDLDAGRHTRNKADQCVYGSHHYSFTRLRRSRRNSSGSKRAPRYCTRRMPRGSTIEVRNEWSTSPSAVFAANTP